MTKLTRPLLVSLIVISFPAALAAQDVTSRALEVTLGAQAQVLFSTTDQEGATPQLTELRRIRLDVRARVTPLISVRIQPELSGSNVGVRNAYVSVHPGPRTEVWIGNAHRPFGNVTHASSARILTAERGVRIRGLAAPGMDHVNILYALSYADRDVGVQLRYAFPSGWAPTVSGGVFNGPLVQLPVGSAQLVARGTVRPHPEIQLGAGWSRRAFAREFPLTSASYETRGGNAFQTDLEVGGYRAGPHLILEVAAGTADPFERLGFRAAHAQLAYRTRPSGEHAFQVEPVLRASHAATDAALHVGGGTLATAGLNLYAGPLNRLVVNLERWTPQRDHTPATSLKVMVQSAF